MRQKIAHHTVELLLRVLLLLLVVGNLGVPARATPPNTIGQSVAVCDPWNPQNCTQPSAAGGISSAQQPVSPGQYTPVSDAASTALTVPSGATYAVICAEVANHRFTWDGTTTPTTSVGTQLLQNTCVQMSGSLALAAFRIITQSAGGTFTVSYGK